MIRAAASLFCDDYTDYKKERTRKIYGILCSVLGIIMNLVLFLIKLCAAVYSGSSAIYADAVHSLTDIGSSLSSFVSFFLSKRAENIAAFVTGVSLFTAGIKLLIDSASAIFEKTSVISSNVALLLLIFSVLVKLLMAYENRKYSILLSSSALGAACTDCLCDCVSTFSAIAALIVGEYTNFNVDACGGIFVSLFMLFSGVKIIAGFCLFFCRKS